MVDPNPARGMPLQLQRYWLAGKGAAKIRWGMPHDFNRCVRQLRKYFPTNPEGLCNILHTKALGAPPGKGHGDKLAITAAAELLAVQPVLGTSLWAMPLVPIGRDTEEPRLSRRFNPGSLKHRVLPLPLDWREKDAPGHQGSVTVGRILGITYGPDHEGNEWAWGWGDWLDEEKIPDVTKARYLAEQGVVGGSIDPGGKVVATVDPETGQQYIGDYTIGGATLVPRAAFSGTRVYCLDTDGNWPDDDPDMVMDLVDEDDCGCGGEPELSTRPVGPTELPAAVFSVNSEGWRGLPLALRESVFDNDDAVKRIQAWATGEGGVVDPEKLKRAFLWHDTSQPETVTQSYRLPVGDIINGRLTMIYHAIYAAAALISGAHGGLPNVPDEEKNQMRSIITDIYASMAQEFNDPNMRAPWDNPAAGAAAAEGYQPAQTQGQFAADQEDDMAKYPVRPPKAWFGDPKLKGPTSITVTPEGRVFGHIAQWDVCHRDFNECVLAPKSKMEYRPFHLGKAVTAEGDTIRVGKIQMDTTHADVRLSYAAAAFHYDDTGNEAAVVRAGEDEFGIWVAGAMVPEADDKRVARLLRSPISGDWRTVEGNLELVAALAVNVPAFPVYTMEGTERFALVAAGMLLPGTATPDDSSEDNDLAAQTVEALVAAAEAMVARHEQERFSELQARLADIAEDEEIYDQRDMVDRLALIAAAETAVAPAPAPAAPAPAAPAPVAPASAAAAPVPAAPVAPPTGEQLETLPEDQRISAMNAMGRFSVIAEPEGADDGVEPVDEEPAPAAPVAAQAPAPAAPAPAAPAPVA